jgi:hypothetical protein
MAIFGALFRSFAALAACVLGSATISAAEIRVDPSRTTGSRAVFEGKIEAGDFDKFKNFLRNDAHTSEIYLASPGGDLSEAMKIGLLVRILRLSTIVPSKDLTNQSRVSAIAQHNLTAPKANYLCASACFFVFVAGIHRSSDDLGPAILGIHRPSLSDKDSRRLNFDQAVAVNERARTTIENYLKVMDVPARYAEDMYSVPKGKIQWIRNDEFQADFAGFIPELRDLVVARCGGRADIGKKTSVEPGNTTMTKSGSQLDCEEKLQDELALEAHDNALKSRNNEAPQSAPDGILASPQK